MVWNRPRHPQDNGLVERVHGLLDTWGEPATCPDAATWAKRVAWVAETQRTRYPVDGHPSRLAACPALAQGGTPYDPATEATQWDVRRVWAVLAQGVWGRRVDKVGRISLYNHAYKVGRAYAGQDVWVRFEQTTQEWVIRAADETELARHPAAELTTERICTLTVSAPLPPRQNLPAVAGP